MWTEEHDDDGMSDLPHEEHRRVLDLLREAEMLRREDGDDDAAALRRTLTAMLKELRPGSTRLSPLDVRFYNLTTKALDELAAALEWDEDAVVKYNKAEHIDKARMIARRYARHESDAHVIEQLLWASNCSAQQMKLNAPTKSYREVLQAIERATDVDLVDPDPDDAGLQVGRAPRPIDAQELKDGRLAVTYARVVRKAAVVNDDFELTRPVEVVNCTAFFRSDSDVVEVRGPAAEVARVKKQLVHDLNSGGMHVAEDSRPMTIEVANELVRLLTGTVRRAKVRPPDDKGVGSVDLVSAPNDPNKPGDVRNSGMFKEDLKGCAAASYHVSLNLDGHPITMRINLATGRFTFPHSVTSEVAIQQVFAACDLAHKNIAKVRGQ